MTHSEFKKGMLEIAEILQKLPDSVSERAFELLLLSMFKGEITQEDFELYPFGPDDFDDDDFDEDDDDEYYDDEDDDELFDKN